MRTQLAPLIALLLLGAGAIWRYGLHSLIGLLGASLIVITIAFGGANLLVPPTLELNERGFTWRSWRYSATFNWCDIDRFRVGPQISVGQPKIAFDFLPERIPDHVKSTELNCAVSGFDRSMANVWDLPTDELVDLMNQYVANSRQLQS